MGKGDLRPSRDLSPNTTAQASSPHPSPRWGVDSPVVTVLHRPGRGAVPREVPYRSAEERRSPPRKTDRTGSRPAQRAQVGEQTRRR
jgi:hypothetical protein